MFLTQTGCRSQTDADGEVTDLLDPASCVYRVSRVRYPPEFERVRLAVTPLEQRDLRMNDLEQKRIEKTVAAFVAKRRPPAHLRDQVDLSFRFDGRNVEIFEIRPRWDNPAQRVEEAIAKARYLKSRNRWLVYWQKADLKWHKYDPMPEVITVDAFLRLVDDDQYACFFG